MDHHTLRLHPRLSISTPSPNRGHHVRQLFAGRAALLAIALVTLAGLAVSPAFAQNQSGVEILGGNGQRGVVGELLGRSFRVRVVDAAGAPVPGAAVQWNIIFGEATLTGGGVTVSDASGEARNRLRFGSRLGLVQVSVRAAGAEDSEIFTAKVDPEADPTRRAFDLACNDDLNGLGGVCGYVDGLSEEDQELVRDALEPDEVAAQATVSQEMARSHLDAVSARLNAVRHAGLRAKDSDGEDRLGFFVSASTATAERPRDLDEAAFDNDTVGVTAGLDYRFSNGVTLGVAAATFDADADFFDDAGSLDVESHFFSIYLAKAWESGFYAQAVAAFGSGDYDTVRHLDLPVAFRGKTRFSASASPEGDHTAGQLELGYTRRLHSELVLTGFLRGRLVDLSIDGYRESGDPDGVGFYLEILDQDIESFQVEAGVDLAWPLRRSWGTLTPSVQLSLLRELDDQGEPIRARFLADPAANLLVLPTAEPDENFVHFAANLVAHFHSGTGLYFSYGIDLERADYEVEVLRGGVSFAF